MMYNEEGKQSTKRFERKFWLCIKLKPLTKPLKKDVDIEAILYSSQFLWSLVSLLKYFAPHFFMLSH